MMSSDLLKIFFLTTFLKSLDFTSLGLLIYYTFSPARLVEIYAKSIPLSTIFWTSSK